MSTIKRYVDVGHLDDAVLWIWTRGKIDTASTKGGRTHEKVWGAQAMNSWRGRFEPDTGILSIATPFAQRNKDAPAWLMGALEQKFGGDLDVYQFNPGKVKRRASG